MKPRRVDSLAAEIRRHNKAYWENTPEISDEQYDGLVEDLRELDPKHPVLNELGLPPGEYRHSTPMLSLQKCYQEAKLTSWLRSIGEDETIYATPKLDGVAGALHYRKGRLVTAVTRGDGLKGEVIDLALIEHIAGIPLYIGDLDIEVRGEFILPLPAFARVSHRLANPRNAAAGALKAKTAKSVEGLGLHFTAYWMRGIRQESEIYNLCTLKNLGFFRVPYETFNGGDYLTAAGICRQWQEQRVDFDYEIDGVVFKVADIPTQEELGYTGHHPRYAMAWKLPSESHVARVTSIEWSVSRMGIITPVAHITPTKLSGAVVSKVSLHNVDIMRSQGIGVDCQVRVTRRGSVIPQIEEVVGERGTVPLPSICPACMGPTQRVNGVLHCAYPDDCDGVLIGRILHFTAVLGVDGFGEVLVAQLVETGKVNRLGDLFQLTTKDMEDLPRMGKKSAARVLLNLQRCQRSAIPLADFLRSLGVPELGRTVSRQLAEHFDGLSAVRSASEKDLVALPGIGATMAQLIVSGLKKDEDLINSLLGVLRTANQKTQEGSGNSLKGISFVFTGKMLSMGRKEAQEAIRSQGGTTPSTLSAKTSWLVIGDGGGGGAKRSKAEKLNVKVITESEFLANFWAEQVSSW